MFVEMPELGFLFFSSSETIFVPFLYLLFAWKNLQNPAGMRKDGRCMEKLKVLLEGKDRVGTPEIAKLLSQQFVNSA